METANEFGIRPRDYRLLEVAAEAEGMEILEMMEKGTYDSVAVGICTKCENTQEVEPDARENWCEECSTPTVRSVLDIAGMI